MNSVLTPSRRRSDRLVGAATLLIGFAALAALFAVARLGVGETISYRRLTVENPSPYTVNVEVTGAARDGWLKLGSFRREGRRTVEELADQGHEWVFRFSYGGVDAGELAVDRDQLAKNGWSVTVPPEVGERLQEAGLSESAR